MQQKFHLNFIETAINSGSKKSILLTTFFLIFDLQKDSLLFSFRTLELDWNFLKN